MPGEVIMELRDIEKTFPGVKALDRVNLKLRKQSVHALLGENGAGKSTLMKILSGVYSLEEGSIYLEGEQVKFANVHESMGRGIAIIHQELNLCWNLTVAEVIVQTERLLRPDESQNRLPIVAITVSTASPLASELPTFNLFVFQPCFTRSKLSSLTGSFTASAS